MTNSSITQPATGFRRDINGLRAIAVAVVVLYHFGVPGFTGGFVGVDVFFVISGFLMTGIIIEGLSKKSQRQFSFYHFYMARARRIVPALLVFIMSILVLGWVLLSPQDYSLLARQVERAVMFVSNLFFYKRTGGYFEASSHEQMLLHTWSLSVEWQFYIIYPVFLYLIHKFFYRAIPFFLLSAFLTSLFFSILKTYSDSSYAFYMLSTRAWEMLLGGLVFYLAKRRVKIFNQAALYYFALLLIVGSVLLFDSRMFWPGYAALIPAIGAAVFLYANHKSYITENKFFQLLGVASYSIYLWHWPLVVILALYSIVNIGVMTAIMIFLSIVLGMASYFYIEMPAKNIFNPKRTVLLILVIVVFFSIILYATYKIIKQHGLPERISEQVSLLFNAEYDRFHVMTTCHENRENNLDVDCVYGDDIGVIVIGDSHAMSFMPAIVNVASRSKHGVLDWSGSGCPTIENIKFLASDDDTCGRYVAEKVKKLADYPGTPVFISNRYSSYLLGSDEKGGVQAAVFYVDEKFNTTDRPYTDSVYKHYKKTMCSIAENNPVYIFRPVPELPEHVPRVMGRSLLYDSTHKRIFIPKSQYGERSNIANQLVDELVADCGLIAIDVAGLLCEDDFCYGDADGRPLYFDWNHLNLYGASLFQKSIEKILSEHIHE